MVLILFFSPLFKEVGKQAHYIDFGCDLLSTPFPSPEILRVTIQLRRVLIVVKMSFQAKQTFVRRELIPPAVFKGVRLP